jgi:hypothetical protein
MAEVLSNGTFDSNLDDWDKWGGSSREMFIYDATGAAHDGGSVRARHIGEPLTTVKFSMMQDFSITTVDDIKTATVDAWCQFNDAWPAAQAEVSKSTVEFTVSLRDPDGVFHQVANTTRYFGSLTAISLLTDEDVKSIFTAGGNGTWYFHVSAFIYRANIEAGWFVAWFDDLSLDIAYYDYGSHTDTITMTDTGSASFSGSATHTDTITISDSAAASAIGSADPTFRYYFGSYDGKIYAEESAYKSDDGTAIDAYWESKETDFAEQGIDTLDKFKTIYKIRLWYVDISSLVTPVSVSVKPDSASSWTTATENVGGSGDDTNKCKDFYMIKSGNNFRFRVENDSTNNEFQWTALEVYYTLGGDYFQE